MDIQALTDFFMWCSIINGGLLLFWAFFIMLAPDLVYRIQTKWVPISRENFDIAMYSFIGLFKLFILVFNLVPYIVLTIII